MNQKVTENVVKITPSNIMVKMVQIKIKHSQGSVTKEGYQKPVSQEARDQHSRRK